MLTHPRHGGQPSGPKHTIDILGYCSRSIAYSSSVVSSEIQSQYPYFCGFPTDCLLVVVVRLLVDQPADLLLCPWSDLVRTHFGMLSLVSCRDVLGLRSDWPQTCCAAATGVSDLGLTQCRWKVEGSLANLDEITD